MIALRTASGLQIDLEYLHPDHVKVSDIARALSCVCRFAGHVPTFYSVAQHAVLVSLLVPDPLRRAALHHDDSEAYLGDVSRNLKHSAYLDGYRVLERRTERTINRALRIVPLTTEQERILKSADDLACIYERIVLVEQKPFQAERDVAWAIGHQYVRSGRVDLLQRARQLVSVPQPWAPLDPKAAEALYLQHELRTSVL